MPTSTQNSSTLIGFDMDGTLINSMGLTLDIIQDVVFEVEGIRVEHPDITKHFGNPEEVIFERMFGVEKGVRVLNAYVKAFENRLDDVLLFDGILASLKALKAEQFKLALYTGRGRPSTVPMVKHLGLDQYFDEILTGSDVKKSKPHPEGLERLMKKFNATADRTAYIGDSKMDILMAQSLGTKAYAVGWCPLFKIEDLGDSKPHGVFLKSEDLLSRLLSDFV